MLTAVRRRLGSLINRSGYWPIFYRRYNNVLGPRLNETYRRFGNQCRAHYRRMTGESLDPRQSAIFQTGSILMRDVLPSAKADAMSSDITRRIEQDDEVTKGPMSYLQIKVNRPISRYGEDALATLRNPEVDRELMKFFGGWYRLVYAESYRSFPTDKPQASWLWHSDSYPVETCKVMIFLTDAGKDQGATQFMTREDTMAYRKAGYFGTISKDRRADLDVFAQEHGLPFRPFFHDAKRGDVMLFENNCLHRGVPPVSGWRDVVVFALLPSMRPWEEQLTIDGLDLIESSTHFPKDPAGNAAMGGAMM